MAIQFKERTRGVQPTAQIGLDTAVSQRTYVLYDDTGAIPNPTQRHSVIQGILGFTLQYPADQQSAIAGAGSINRVMPLGDPQDQCLFADGPISIAAPPDESLGAAFANDPTLAVVTADGYAAYNSYEYAVRFTNRPYSIFPNERLVRQSLNFYDEAGVSKTLYYYKEWLRFCHCFSKFIDIRVSASQAAAMRFRTNPNNTEGIGNTQFTAIPAMMIPDTQLIFRWYAVPQRYITHPNSFLMRYRGYINQVAFKVGPDTDYQPGQLLYVGCETLRTYNQVDFEPTKIGNPRVLGDKGAPVVAVDGDETELVGTFGGNTVCDLELNFILTNRPNPVPAITDDFFPNKNWVPFHHNLLAHFQTKTFQYATADRTDKINWVPSYLSVPFQILWGDPAWDGHTVTP